MERMDNMKKILCAIIAMLMLLVSCDKSETPNDTTREIEVYAPVTLSDEPLSVLLLDPIKYNQGYIYTKVTVSSGSYLVRYNCKTGKTSTVCADPLCFHDNEECPMVGIEIWNVLPNGNICYSHKFKMNYRNDAGVITKKVDIFDHAVYNPRDGKKTVLYKYDSGYFSAPELYSEDYRFYQSIEYNKERELFVCGLYRMNLDNGDIKLLLEYAASEEGNSFVVTSNLIMLKDNRIYLEGNQSVFSIDFEGENRITHLEGSFPSTVYSNGDYVFYKDDDGIYRRSLSGGEEEHIVECDNIYGDIALTTNWIYWQAGDKITLGKANIPGYSAKEVTLSGGEIYRCRHDGSELTKITTMSGEYEHVRPMKLLPAGDYIYTIFTGWQDKNNDGIFTGDEQFTSPVQGEAARIYRIDTVSGEIIPLDLK